MDKTDEKLKQLLSLNSVKADEKWAHNTQRKLELLASQSSSSKLSLLLKPYYFLFSSAMNLLPTIAAKVAAITLGGIISVGGVGAVTVNAAKNSQPGDPLYGLNKAIENLERNTISDPKSKAEYELQLLTKKTEMKNQIQNQGDANKLQEAEKEVAEQELNLENSLKNCNDCNETEFRNRNGSSNDDSVVSAPRKSDDSSQPQQNNSNDSQEVQNQQQERNQEQEKSGSNSNDSGSMNDNSGKPDDSGSDN